MEKQLAGVPAQCWRKAQLYQAQAAVLAHRGSQELVEALTRPCSSRILTTGLQDNFS